MLLQTNSYIVPKEKRAEHTRLVRRFRHTLARLGCEHFEVYEQVGANWTGGDSGGRFVQIIRFRDRQHQIAVQAAERADSDAQAVIADFCDLINLPYQQQQGLFAMGYYHSVLPVTAPRVRVQDDLSVEDAITAESAEAVAAPADDLQAEEEAYGEEAYSEELTEEPAIDEAATEGEKFEEPAAEIEPDLGLEWAEEPLHAPHAPALAPVAELHEAADLGELDLEPQAAEPVEEEIAPAPMLAAEELIGETEVEDALDEALGHDESAEHHAEELHDLGDHGLALEAPEELEAIGEETVSAEDELAEEFGEEELPAEAGLTEEPAAEETQTEEELLSETQASGEEEAVGEEELLGEEETLAEDELADAEALGEEEEPAGEEAVAEEEHPGEEAVAEEEQAGEEEWSSDAEEGEVEMTGDEEVLAEDEALTEEEAVAEEEELAEEEALGGEEALSHDEALSEEEALADEEAAPEAEMHADEEEESEHEALSEEELFEEEAVGEEPAEAEAVEEGLEEEVAEDGETEPEALDLDAEAELHDEHGEHAAAEDHLADTAGLDMARQPVVDLLSETAVESAPAMGGDGSHDPAPVSQGANGHGAASLHEGQNGDAEFFSDAEIDDALNEALKELDEFDGSSVAAKPR
jgi:hypothetical protein